MAETSSSPSASTTPQLSALPRVPLVVPDPAVDYSPMRKIFTEADIPNWIDSEAYYRIELIIARLSVAVDGKKVEDACHESEVSLWASETLNASAGRRVGRAADVILVACGGRQAVKACVRFLEDLTAKVDDVTLDPSPQRFGNKAFRDWLTVMEDVRWRFL